jgi:cell division protein FtsZ
LTVAIVTLPFSFEGPERMNNAMKGLTDLEKHVDTIIVVPNDRVAALSQKEMSFLKAFSMADEVLHNGVRAISELITVPGLINLDFADVRTIMQARGRALMGIGMAEGENRAIRAAEEAIICPLLEQSNINGAMGVIVNIKGGVDIGMREVQEAVTAVKKAAHPNANIIFGAVVDEEQRPELQVTVIAAGFPKNVSESFSSGEWAGFQAGAGAGTLAAAHPAAKPEHAHASRPAAAPAAAAVPAMAPAEPEELDLFPKDDPGTSEITEPESDVEEDMGIPKFLRSRLMNKRKKK